MVPDFLVYLIGGLSVWLIFGWMNKRNSKEPPGPMSLPIIGNLVQLAMEDKRAHFAFENLSKTYGNIFKLRLGAVKMVVISGFEDIFELLSFEQTDSRNIDSLLVDRNYGKNLGIIFSEGKRYTEMKKFAVSTLKSFGFGKSGMEEKVQEEIHEIGEFLEKLASKNPKEIVHIDSVFFMLSTLNIISSLVTGERYSRYDKDALIFKLMAGSRKHASGAGVGGGLHNAFPILKYICPELIGCKQMLDGIKEMQEVARLFLDEFRRRRENITEPESFADVFVNKTEGESKNPNLELSDDQFVVTMMDFVQGGSETSSNTLGFAFLYLSSYPEVQKKLFAEITAVVGPNRLPTLGDRERMIYAQAFVLELLRSASVVTILPRLAMEDFVFKGFQITKGTTIICNMRTIFADKSYWIDPDTFRPERFITEKGTIDKEKYDRVMAFGKGRRMCIAENLARDNLFLFTTTLIQKFEMSIPLGSNPSLEQECGWTNNYHPYDIVLKKRSEFV